MTQNDTTTFGGFALERDGVRLGPALHVGYLPGSTSCCLYLLDGGSLRRLAYFRSHEAAGEAYRALGYLMRLHPWEGAA